MLVRLKQNVFEPDRFGNLSLKVTQRPTRGIVIAWTAGTVIDMSDASAAKYISEGKAEAAPEEKQA
jgi:hypothetical protein